MNPVDFGRLEPQRGTLRNNLRREVPTMFCAACGQAVDASQTFCPRCGRQIAPIGSYAPVPYQRSRVHRHMHTVAALWIVYSVWILLQLGDCGRSSWRSLQPLDPVQPWFRWALRIYVFPRKLAGAVHHCGSGGSSYSLRWRPESACCDALRGRGYWPSSLRFLPLFTLLAERY